MKLNDLISESTDEEKIRVFLKEHGFMREQYWLDDNNRVCFKSILRANELVKDGKFPSFLKFGSIGFDGKETFHLHGTSITAFGDWLPTKCYELSLDRNKFSSFDGFKEPEGCVEYNFATNNFTNLHNIHTYIPNARSITLLGSDDNTNKHTIKKNILGLCLLPKLRWINNWNREIYVNESIRSYKDGKYLSNDKEISPFAYALGIVGKYIGEGKSGMIKAQRELIENDLDDYAEV